MPIKDMPLTNKQHAVPQNIMDVEFKLIGDLTMRQFAYLFIFGAIAWGTFLTVKGIFKWPIVIVAILLGVGLAFVPLEDRGLDQWIINFFKSVYSPTQKVWRKDPQVPLAFTYQNLAVLRQELITLAPTSSRRKLEEYLEYQGKEGKNLDKYDLAEQEYINKVREAFGTRTEVVVDTEVYQDVGPVAASPAPPALPPLLPASHMPVASSPTPQAPQVSLEPPKLEKPPEEPKPQPIQQPAPKPVMQPVTPAPVVAIPQQPAPRPQPQTQPQQPQPIIKKTKILTDYPKVKSHEVALSPLTPDRHSGRRFVSLLPKQGEIVLPIRGEKVLKTSEELDIESDIKEKTEQLQKLIGQIKTSEGFNKKKSESPKQQSQEQYQMQQKPQPQQLPPIQQVSPQGPKIEITPPVVGSKVDINSETQSVIENIKAENARLAKEIENLKNELAQSQQTDQEKLQKQQDLDRLEREKVKAKEYYDEVQAKVQELQSKITEKEKIETPPPLPQLPPLPANRPPVNAAPATTPVAAPTSSAAPVLGAKPNIISGIVKDPDGNVFDGAVVIIKDSNNEPKRAIKTNILGKFSLATPLADGSYLVEITKSDKMNYSFDIISVVVKGEPIPPLEFIGKR